MSSNITSYYVNLQSLYNPPPLTNFLTLTTLMTRLSHLVNLTDFQKDALQKVNDFCNSHNFTITNHDVFTETNHQNILERLAIRILVKIKSQLIDPTADLVTKFLQRAWDIYEATDANKELLALEDSPGSQKEQIAEGLKIIKPLIDQECHAWAEFFTPINQKLIETHLHTIKHFLLTTFLNLNLMSNSKVQTEFLQLIHDIMNAEKTTIPLFGEFKKICSTILKKSQFQASEDDELDFYFKFSAARTNLISLLKYIEGAIIPAIFVGINNARQIAKRDPSFLDL